MRFKVELDLAKKLSEHIKTSGAEALGRELQINREHVVRLARGNWNDVEQAQLQRLATWARKHGYSPQLFSYDRPHPLWQSFDNSTARLVVGCNAQKVVNPDDNDAQSLFNRFLHQDNCAATLDRMQSPDDDRSRRSLIEKVTEIVSTQNAIFICGPRRNAASEVACALLWGAEPFSTEESERAKLPFHLRYYNDAPERLDSCCASISNQTSERALIAEGRTLAFPFRPQAQWLQKASPAFDFAVVALCRRPQIARADVTTIVISGLTGFATRSACESLAAEELYIDQLVPGVPEYRVFCAKFRRNKGENNRELSAGSKWVGPPWDYPAGAVTSPGKPNKK